jgi:hypothetical protein
MLTKWHFGSRARVLSDKRFIAAIYALTTLITTWQKYATGHDNNLRIFRASFFNLMAGRDLYALHPEQYYDYFKYSPTFALLMAPFAAVPELAAAMLWSFCNVFALFLAIQLLDLSQKQKALVYWLILVELVTSIQNFQSNALVAALIIGTFVALEREQPEAAGFLVALGASIKIFGGAGVVFILFYPKKTRFVFATIVSALLLVSVPLLVSSAAQLGWQYGNWFSRLQSDYLTPEKLSIMNWFHAWFGVDWPKEMVQIIGACFFLLPIGIASMQSARTRLESRWLRLTFLASLLVFLVIFNHKAESPMFILAVTGVAIWCAAFPQNGVHAFVMALVLVFTSLGSTDLVPRYWRDTIGNPFVVKVVPCILAWVVIQVELLRASSNCSRRPVDDAGWLL